MPACSLTVVRGRCRCAVETTGAARGASAAAAIAANWSAVRPSSTSGSRSAKPGSIGTRRGNLRPWSVICAARIAAASLYARYCSSLAKSRSLASSRARSSSSSTSPDGSSLAAFRSSRVAATTRK